MAVNVGMSKQSKKSFLLLNMTNVEATAGGEWNDPIDWLDQGFTKDEKVIKSACGTVTNEFSISGYGLNFDYNNTESYPPEAFKIRCGHGSVNCSAVDC